MPIEVRHEPNAILSSALGFLASSGAARQEAKRRKEEQEARLREVQNRTILAGVESGGRAIMAAAQQNAANQAAEDQLRLRSELEMEQFAQKKQQEGYQYDFTPEQRAELNEVDNAISKAASEFSSGNMTGDAFWQVDQQLQERKAGIQKTWVFRGPKEPTWEEDVAAGRIVERPENGGAWTKSRKTGDWTFLKYGNDGDNTADVFADIQKERGKQAITYEFDQKDYELKSKDREYARYLKTLETARTMLTVKDENGKDVLPDEYKIHALARRLMESGGSKDVSWQPQNAMTLAQEEMERMQSAGGAPQAAAQPQDPKMQAESRGGEIMSQGKAFNEMTPAEQQELLRLRAIIKGQ